MKTKTTLFPIEAISSDQLKQYKADLADQRALAEKAGKELTTRIEELNLSEMVASEKNLSTLKTIRSTLTKEFKGYEDRRMMAKELAMKPYNDSNDLYKQFISVEFSKADATLKAKIDEVDTGILTIKLNGIKEHFDSVNIYDFVMLEQLDIKIIKSRSDKKIKDEIAEKLASIEQDIQTIGALDNSDRVLAKYQASLNLNTAISEVSQEVQRETVIAENKQKAEQQQAHPAPKVAEPEPPIIENEIQPGKLSEVEQEEVKYKSTFTALGTKVQLLELKEFMKNRGISYE